MQMLDSGSLLFHNEDVKILFDVVSYIYKKNLDYIYSKYDGAKVDGELFWLIGKITSNEKMLEINRMKKGESVVMCEAWGREIMMNKKKLCIIIVIAIIVTGLAVTFAVLSKSGKHKENVNAESTVNNEKQTGSVTEAAKADENTAQPGGSDSGNNSGNSADTGSNAGIVTTVPTGRLQVSGTKLTDESGNIIQLRGVSTHGISWFPDYVNYDAFATLRDDWGANVVRIAMYPEEYNGYLSGGDKAALKQIIDNGVNYATQLGMYVIIDWHVLNYAPSRHTQEACDFFAEMASKYSGHDNVIYEICNEPVGADWNADIKPYAETVIGTIRQFDDHALILVGTNTWSQDVDSVVGNTLDDGNVMYVAHFYAGTHKENIRNKISTALNAGVPVFISECSICDASGNGGIDYASANEWLDFMNSNQLSFIAWSLSNKAETSALISSGCSAKSGWSDGDLSETGRWFKSAISGR